MANEMSWKECIDENIITKTVPDEERANQMLQMSNLRLKFWDKKISDEFTVLKVEDYYDIIKELNTYYYSTPRNNISIPILFFCLYADKFTKRILYYIKIIKVVYALSITTF